MKVLKLLILFLVTLLNSIEAYQYDFAAVSLFRDEARFLKEWIEFHRMLGVKHFYLYNHLSKDNYMDILTPYIKKGIVELVEIQTEPKDIYEWHDIQLEAYNDALVKARGKVKWLAILDSDEFLFATKQNSLPDFFERYEKMNEIGGVCVNWVMFGTSFVPRVPDNKLMIEMLTLCKAKEYEYFKSIVRPERVASCCNAHYCLYNQGISHCTAECSPVLPPFVQIENIRINHYWTRDEDFFYNIKVPRRLAWGASHKVCLEKLSMYNQDHDETISRFIPPLRKRVGLELSN